MLSAVVAGGNAPGAEGGLGPVGGLELVQDAGDMVLHGLQGDREGAGDLLVAGTFGQQVEYLTFSHSQVVWPGWEAGPGSRPGVRARSRVATPAPKVAPPAATVRSAAGSGRRMRP